MNYLKIYDNVVQKYRQNPPDRTKEYCETHHVLPRSFGGTDNPDNMVTLPVRAHIFCHELLYKHWKDLAWKTMDNEAISNAGLMALALDRLHNGTERQTNAMACFSSKVFAHAKADGHETLKNMIWINDGRQNTMVDRRNPKAIPEGWVRGMLYKDNRHDYVWVTNGKKDMRLTSKTKIPSGYWLGRTHGSGAKNMFWINNGIIDKYVKKDSLIPDGWVKGRLSICGDNSIRRRKTKIHEFRGQKYTLTELAVDVMGIGQTVLVKFMKQGFSFEEIYEIIEKRRQNRKPNISYNGRLYKITELSRETGIDRAVIRQKLNEGMTAEEIVAWKKQREHRRILFNGKRYTITELHRMSGLARCTIRQRLKQGMTIEAIFLYYGIKTEQSKQ